MVRAAARSWRRRLSGLDATDREVLALWAGTRLAAVVLTAVSVLVLSGRAAGHLPPPLTLWQRWDVNLYRKVAQYGYDGFPEHYRDRGIDAFFPGLPVLLRAVHLVVSTWTLSGLLVSAAALAVAVVALGRLAALEGVPGRLPVLLLLTSPLAVFLTAGYAESLFLACAVPAWLAARRDRWRRAGLLAGLAGLVRINAVFLLAGLVVLAVQRGRRDRQLAWLLTPLATVGGYWAWLWARTGDPLRWLHAQGEGWHRRPHWPWQTLLNTAALAGRPRLRSDYTTELAVEILAVAVGLLLVVLLVRARRYGEAAYVGTTLAVLMTSTYYLAAARSTLLWFPLWLLLGRAAVRWRPLVGSWLAVVAPISAGLLLAFTLGFWVG